MASIESTSCPVLMVSRSRTRIAAISGSMFAGARSVKCDAIESSSESRPSSTAKPTAVELKLLLTEYST
jgi:hypothetical protein